MILRRRTRSPNAVLFVLVVALSSSLSRGAEPASGDTPAPEESAARPVRKNVKLPGLVIDFQQRCVDLEGSVCLDEGMLELVACTKGSKEHESIVAITAKPMHIHAALLMLGANNGNPAMRRPIGDRETRWIDVPPRGDPVEVSLVFDNPDGKQVEHPISDFIARSDKRVDEADDDEGDAEGNREFSNTFLFAGSHLVDEGSGPRKYLADHSGNVISIATFGDELLCLPGMHAKANDALIWQVDSAKLPKVGAKVTLRLRPRLKPAAEAGDADEPSSAARPNATVSE